MHRRYRINLGTINNICCKVDQARLYPGLQHGTLWNYMLSYLRLCICGFVFICKCRRSFLWIYLCVIYTDYHSYQNWIWRTLRFAFLAVWCQAYWYFSHVDTCCIMHVFYWMPLTIFCCSQRWTFLQIIKFQFHCVKILCHYCGPVKLELCSPRN